MSQSHNFGNSGDDNATLGRQSEPQNLRRHSELALTSFVMSIIAMILIVGMVIWSSLASDRLQPNAAGDVQPFIATGVLMVCGFLFLSIIGTFLGLIDLVLPNRKKVFALLGFTLNLSTLVANALLGFVGGVFGHLANMMRPFK